MMMKNRDDSGIIDSSSRKLSSFVRSFGALKTVYNSFYFEGVTWWWSHDRIHD